MPLMKIVFDVDHEIILGEKKWLMRVNDDAQSSLYVEPWLNLLCWKSGYLLVSFQDHGETIFLDCNKTWMLIVNNAFASCGVLMKFLLFFSGNSIMSKIPLKKQNKTVFKFSKWGRAFDIFFFLYFLFFHSLACFILRSI